MSRRKRSKRQGIRPSGSIATDSTRVVDLVANFDSQLNAAALQNAVVARVPYGHIQTIVPGANYKGKANTAEAHARLRAMKQGVDPALNKRFETAAEAREYRKRERIEALSPREYDSETANMRSSRRYNAWLDAPDTGGRDPDTGAKIEGFNPTAFDTGAQVLNQLESQGFKLGR